MPTQAPSRDGAAATARANETAARPLQAMVEPRCRLGNSPTSALVHRQRAFAGRNLCEHREPFSER